MTKRQKIVHVKRDILKKRINALFKAPRERRGARE